MQSCMGEVDEPGCCISLVPEVGGEGALRLLLSLSLLMSRPPLPPEAVRNDAAAAAAVIAGESEDEVVSVVLERSFNRLPGRTAIMIQ